MVGTKTNIITAVVIDGPDAGDSPRVQAALLETTAANGFNVRRRVRRQGYLAARTSNWSSSDGGTAVHPVQGQQPAGRERASSGRRMYGYFTVQPRRVPEALSPAVERRITFSMVKAKFRDRRAEPRPTRR